MLPVPYRVTSRQAETHDSVTLRLDPLGERLAPAQPGQFSMLAVPRIGEVAISASGVPQPGEASLEHTIRAVGAVSRALHGARPGTILGVRGPFGTTWDLPSAAGRDLVIVAGGVGLAPLRPVVSARWPTGTPTAGSAWWWAPGRRPNCCSAENWNLGCRRTWRWIDHRPAFGWLGRAVGFVTDAGRGSGWTRAVAPRSCADPSR